MSLSNAEWLKRTSFIGCGLLLGFVAGVNTVSKSDAVNSDVVNIDSREEKACQSFDSDLKASLEQIVRSEMKVQFAAGLDSLHKSIPANIAAPPVAPEKNIKEVRVEQFTDAALIYDSANDELDAVISSGGFNSESAKKYVSYLHSLSPEKAFELRVKFANAVNMGLIKNPSSPESMMDRD
ncbi:MAG: hypothetical protein V4660_15525 [Pseudomonadota bacterium]